MTLQDEAINALLKSALLIKILKQLAKKPTPTIILSKVLKISTLEAVHMMDLLKKFDLIERVPGIQIGVYWRLTNKGKYYLEKVGNRSI